MRSGDLVMTRGGYPWVVTLVNLNGPDPGRHVFLRRATSGFESLVCLLPETEVALSPLPGPSFAKGDVYEVEGERATVHGDYGMVIVFQREDGRFLPLWRHEAALLWLLGRKGFSFLCEETSIATEEQI